MRKISLIIGLSIILFSTTSPLTAQAAEKQCAWRAEMTQTNPETNTSQTTGGCYSGETQSVQGGTETCNTARPENSSSGFTYTRYICCCGELTQPNAAVASPAKAPKYIMPEFQVPINTVKLSSSTCVLDDNGEYQCSVPWLGEYITGVYNYGLGIAGILAAIILMAGGVLWLVSGGDASKITQAKELIFGSITGLIILAGSYVLLIQINPELTRFRSISLGMIGGKELKLAEARNSSDAGNYNEIPCATDEELANGIKFYATGYYKPTWENTEKFFCVVSMNCTCPNGRDETKNCDFLYGKSFPGYHPCNSFSADTKYCNMTASGVEPQIGDIAGPRNCQDNLPYGTKVCFKGKTYTITDTGGAIKGKRIDIWSGSSLRDAYANTGVGVLKKGACN